MRDFFYHLLTGYLGMFLWDGKLLDGANLPERGPAVLVANHLETSGPIACCSTLPMRLYPWAVADMVDEARAAAWLQWDFVERTLRLKPPASGIVAQKLAHLTVPLLRSLGCIPVYKGEYERMAETLSLSMDVLRHDRFLLVFAEDNLMPADPVTHMRPFQRTFARLGEMYYAETGKRLHFYPVAVHPSGFVKVGEPTAYDMLNPVGKERHRLKTLMENSVRAMYLQLELGEEYNPDASPKLALPR